MPTPPILLSGQLSCALAPKALWELLADTERLNRALGQAALRCEPHDSDSPARHLLRSQPGARSKVTVIELPPTWSQPSELTLQRQFIGGVLASQVTRYKLTPLLSGTKLTVELELVPRAFDRLLEPYGRWVLRSLLKKIAALDAARGRGEDLLKAVTPLSLLGEASLARAQAQLLEKLPAEQHPLVGKLAMHLRALDDHDRAAMTLRPYVLAEAWGETRDAVLAMCLAAAAHGMLALSWDVICPSCRLPAMQHPHLGELGEDSYCQLCELRVPVELARSVELTFRPGALLRPTPQTVYSGPSPARMPHVLVQGLLPAGGSVTVTVPAEPGEFRLFVRGGLEARVVVSTLGPPGAELTVEGGVSPTRVEVAMGGILTVHHPGKPARHFKLERTEWPERDELALPAVAHAVTLNPAFRRHFSIIGSLGQSGTELAAGGARAELLRAGLALGVPMVGFLLSELTNATELCQRLGDDGAVRVVREHFELLQSVIEGAGGTLVKTERDGVTAAFATTELAARAAFEAQRAFASFRAQNVQATALALRVGVYGGPCHMLSHSGLLDYYGQTLLVAARLLREAHAGDVMLPAELAEPILADPAAKTGPRFLLSIRGLAKPLGVTRLNFVPPEGSPEAAAQPTEPSSVFKLGGGGGGG